MIRLSPRAHTQHDAFRANASRLSRLFAGCTDDKAMLLADGLIQSMKAQLTELRRGLRTEAGAAKQSQRADKATCAGLPLVGAGGFRVGRRS